MGSSYVEFGVATDSLDAGLRLNAQAAHAIATVIAAILAITLWLTAKPALVPLFDTDPVVFTPAILGTNVAILVDITNIIGTTLRLLTVTINTGIAVIAGSAGSTAAIIAALSIPAAGPTQAATLGAFGHDPADAGAHLNGTTQLIGWTEFEQPVVNHAIAVIINSITLFWCQLFR